MSAAAAAATDVSGGRRPETVSDCPSSLDSRTAFSLSLTSIQDLERSGKRVKSRKKLPINKKREMRSDTSLGIIF